MDEGDAAINAGDISIRVAHQFLRGPRGGVARCVPGRVSPGRSDVNGRGSRGPLIQGACDGVPVGWRTGSWRGHHTTGSRGMLRWANRPGPAGVDGAGAAMAALAAPIRRSAGGPIRDSPDATPARSRAVRRGHGGSGTVGSDTRDNGPVTIPRKSRVVRARGFGGSSLASVPPFRQTATARSASSGHARGRHEQRGPQIS
jgi:hypothetical protein